MQTERIHRRPNRIKHVVDVDENILTVKVGRKKYTFQLRGEILNPAEVNLDQPPLGSGAITRLGEKILYGRVHRGEDEQGAFCQILSNPEKIDGVKMEVRYVGPKVRIPYDSPRFNPYTATLNKTRDGWGQKSDS